MVQGKLGVYSVISTRRNGQFLVMSMPHQARHPIQHGTCLCKQIALSTSWVDASIEHTLKHTESGSLIKQTTRMTKCRVPLLCWDKYERQYDDFVADAQSLCDTGERDIVNIQSALPMLAHLEDDRIKQLAIDGRLPSIIKRLGEPRTLQLAGCSHAFICLDRFDSCKPCGAAVGKGRQLRWKCKTCNDIVCSTCKATFQTAMSNEYDANEIIALVKKGGTVSIVNVIQELPHYESEPPSPAALRFRKEVAADLEQQRTREQQEGDEEDYIIVERRARHPTKFDLLAVSDMKQYSEQQQTDALRCGMEACGLSLEGTHETIHKKLPAFLDLYAARVESCFTGSQPRANLFNKGVRKLFELLAQEFDHSYTLPKLASLDPSTREKIERYLHDNQKLTRCRQCKGHLEASGNDMCCSKKCNTKCHKANDGRSSTVCARECRPRYFYNPEGDWT